MMMIYLQRMGQDFKNKKGFTLLEVLITTVILVISILSLLKLLSIGMFTDADIEHSTIALHLAQEKLEEIKSASSYANINSFVLVKSSIGGVFSQFDRAVTVSGDPKQVNVIVYWTVKSNEQNINLVMLFSDYDY